MYVGNRMPPDQSKYVVGSAFDATAVITDMEYAAEVSSADEGAVVDVSAVVYLVTVVAGTDYVVT